MWKIYLDSTRTCEKLTRICQKYEDEFSVDICLGRYTVDGCSILGVMSLLFNKIGIWIPTMDEDAVKEFINDIKEIGAYYEV